MGVNFRSVIRYGVTALGVLLAIGWIKGTVNAQAVEARVTNVSGNVARINLSRKYMLRRGDVLSPGDEIDTRGGGRAVIEMTDGSLVTVQPRSHIVFKDYRAAANLRELFQVLLGRVRVKIAHYGGQPNPYRVNSPTASILVRGTEFGVAVTVSGETRVVVYEGLVEVESLDDPNRRALVSPGRGVLVRPNEDLRFFTPGPGSEIGERGNRSINQNLQETNPANSPGNIHTGAIRNYVAGDYERYIDSLVEPGQTPPILRFTAFPDSHLDSLENPAFATEFGAMEGRVMLVSSRSASRSLHKQLEVQLPGNANPFHPVDSGFLMQNSFFVPLSSLRTVIGGSLATSTSSVMSFSSAEVVGAPSPLYPLGVPGSRISSGETGAASLSGSLVLARRFGKEGRTSVGVSVDHLNGRGTLDGFISLSNTLGLKAREEIEARSDIGRTRFRIGLTHQFRAGHKLGMFYSHGLLHADDRDVKRTFNGLPLSLDSVSYRSRSSELGLRLRGPLTRRLFYGVEALWLTTRLDEQIRRAAIVDTDERERITRAAGSFGIGYSLRSRTVLSADLAFGLSRVHETYSETATGNPLVREQQKMRFASVQAGAQTDVWRNLFANLSICTIAQSQTNDIRLFPDRFGRLLNSRGVYVPDGQTRDRLTDSYADFGIGWRLTRNILAEYLQVRSFDGQSPNHIILLRYTIKREQ